MQAIGNLTSESFDSPRVQRATAREEIFCQTEEAKRQRSGIVPSNSPTRRFQTFLVVSQRTCSAIPARVLPQVIPAPMASLSRLVDRQGQIFAAFTSNRNYTEAPGTCFAQSWTIMKRRGYNET